MKRLFRLACFFTALTVHAQNLFLDFNQKNSFASAFNETTNGVVLSWATGSGIDDQGSGAAGGGVTASGSGGTAYAIHKGSPTFSPDTGLQYFISEYVHLQSAGAQGDNILTILLGSKDFPNSNALGIGVQLVNVDGTNLGVSLESNDPSATIQMAATLTDQPGIGDWLQLVLTIQETNIATGEFTYQINVNDYGPTGLGSLDILYGSGSSTFTDAALSGKACAGWVPVFATDQGGNAFDNFAAGFSAFYSSRLIVAKGDPAAGIANAVFSVIGNPTLSRDANVAFQAYVTGTEKNSGVTAANHSGIWNYSFGSGLSLVAQTGRGSAQAPGTSGGAFSALSDPIYSGTALGFYATLIPGVGDATPTTNAGVWTQASGGSLTNPVRTGDPATGVPGGTITAIDQFGLEENAAAPIIATVSGPGIVAPDNRAFLLPDSNGNLHAVTSSAEGFQVWTPLEFVRGQSRSVDPIHGYGIGSLALNDHLHTIGLATPNGIATSGAGGFTTTTLISDGDLAPGFSGQNAPVIKSFGLPAINAKGTVAFNFTMTGGGITPANNAGIATVVPGTPPTPTLVAQTGAAAPGTAGSLFSSFSAPVLCNSTSGPGTVAFIGGLKPGVGDTAKNGANDRGIWSNFNGPMELFVRKGDAAPGGGSFSSFQQIVMADEQYITFLATISGAPASSNQGIWYTFAQQNIYLIARTGALVPVHGTMKTIKSLKIFTVAPKSMGTTRNFVSTIGDLTFVATFTDGTWAVYGLFFS